MINGNEVLPQERIIIQKVRLITHIQWCDPSFINLCDAEPCAAGAVDVHDDEEYQLEKLQRVLGVLGYVQSCNDTSKSGNTKQLQKTEKCQNLIFFTSKYEKYVFKRNC